MTATLREGVEPYDSERDERSELEGFCYYCEEGTDYDGPHVHDFYVRRDGAASRTADNLAMVFLDDVAALTTYVVPEGLAEIDATEWCEDPDDSQALSDEIPNAESALGDVGLFVVWDDGYSIQRIRETATCRHCGRHIESTALGVWIDPEATGDDIIWRETCDAHETFQAEHEPCLAIFDADSSPFNRQMATGHAMRRNHTLTGYYIETEHAGISKLIRTCCDAEVSK